MQYLLLAVLWIVWCCIHSGMFAPSASEWCERRFGRFYRIIYNTVAVATLVPVLIYFHRLSSQSEVIFRWSGYWIILEVAMIAAAILLGIAGLANYDMLEFLGIRQVKTGSTHQTLSASGELRTSGILHVIRHPWYLGVLLILWSGFPEFTIPTIITCGILSLYVLVGTMLEEKKLIRRFGDEYRRYQQEVSMLFPLKWLWRHVADRQGHFRTKKTAEK